jgi:hypothetical protein
VAGFPYDTLKLETTLNPKRIDTRLNFHGGKLGELMVQAQINPLPKNKPMSGNFRLTGLDLRWRARLCRWSKSSTASSTAAGDFRRAAGAAGQRQRESGGRRFPGRSCLSASRT